MEKKSYSAAVSEGCRGIALQYAPDNHLSLRGGHAIRRLDEQMRSSENSARGVPTASTDRLPDDWSSDSGLTDWALRIYVVNEMLFDGPVSTV